MAPTAITTAVPTKTYPFHALFFAAFIGASDASPLGASVSTTCGVAGTVSAATGAVCAKAVVANKIQQMVFFILISSGRFLHVLLAALTIANTPRDDRLLFRRTAAARSSLSHCAQPFDFLQEFLVD